MDNLNDPKTREELEDLNQNLEILSSEIDESNSRKHSFIRGLFLGVGTTIGATVIAAILIAGLVWVFKTVENVLLIGDILRWLNIEQYIQK